MNRGDFEAAVSAVRARVAVLDATYSQQSFGSWVVTAATTPVRRLLWDGKESWLVVQKSLAVGESGPVAWEHSWMKRSAGPEDLAEAVGQMFQ